MILTIHKGKRRPSGWWKLLRLWYGKRSITRLVWFDQTAKYELPAADQPDTNKLFGIGFLWNRKHSARFCWNWNPDTDKVNLFAYYHRAGMKDSLNVNGAMDFIKLMELDRFKFYRLTIRVKPGIYQFIVSKSGSLPGKTTEVSSGHNKKLSYWLGPYFGGTRKAPNNINIEMKKP
jgi:hypothetical protein